MIEYIRLLKRESFLRGLMITMLIMQLGAWFSQVAISVLLIELKVHPIIIGFSAASAFIPTIVLAPFSGMIIEKFKPKNIFIFCTIIEIFATLLLTTIHKPNIIYIILLMVLIFAKMSVAALYGTTQMSQLPKILSPKDLKLANETQSMVWSTGYISGMALAGIVINIFGTNISFIIDSIFLSLGLIIIISLNFPDILNIKVATKSLFTNAIKYIFNKKILLYLIVLHSVIALTTYDVIIPLMAKFHYSTVIAVPLAIGYLNSIRAISLIVGNSLLSKYLNSKTLRYFLIFQSVSIMIWALMSDNFYLSIIGSFIAGFTTALLWAYTYTLTQINTDKEYYSSVCAYSDMFFMLTASIVVVITGKLATYIETSTIIMMTSLAIIPYIFILIFMQKRYYIKYD